MTDSSTDLRFPDGFLWGASTAAHQTEGGNTNCDWWEWEQGGNGTEPSGIATDSWNLYRRDIAVARDLNLGIVRISVEWARIEPEPGVWDRDALSHYEEVLWAIREAGMRAMVVLWHFTSPLWFTLAGGWKNPDAPMLFADYARVVSERLGDDVDLWATINEPNIYASKGFIEGVWPPGRTKDVFGAVRTLENFAEAHRQARRAIKAALGPAVSVGYTYVTAWAHPASGWGVLSAPMCALWNWLSNDLFMDKVQGATDWIGIQYYHDSPCRPFGLADDDGHVPRTEMRWRVAPEGLYRVIKRAWARYRLPIYVTENGLADAADAQRERFIVDHLRWLHKAICEGADVRGYLHWSLIDNFEWAEGFGPRFGLAEVDYETLERRIRPSALAYAQIAVSNTVGIRAAAGKSYADGTGPLGPEEQRQE